MNPLKLCPMLLLLACAAVSHAGVRHPDTGGTVLLASAADATVPPVHVGAAAVEAHAESAGVAESLPDMPGPAIVLAVAVQAPHASEPAPRETFATALPDGPGVSLLQSSPLAGAARRMHAKNFNTDDGSLADTFAICYRLNRRSSVQVIPGDPAPVKMPVTTMANNMGVTVGMVIRLSRHP